LFNCAPNEGGRGVIKDC